MFNPYIVVPLVTWAIAQLIKFTIQALRGRIDFRNLYATGGMPSVHSAVVASLATTAGLLDGTGSHLFGLTLVVAVIVIYDSLNVRRSTGDQAVALNMLIDSLNSGRVTLSNPNLRLREVLGHTPGEVTVGALLGVLLGGLFNYGKLGPLSNFLSAQPGNIELWIYFGIGMAAFLGSLGLRLALRRRARRLPAWRKLLGGFLVTGITAGALEGLFTFGTLERASFLIWRGWTLFTAAATIMALAWIGWHYGRRIPAQQAVAAETERKEKWLRPGKKRRKR